MNIFASKKAWLESTYFKVFLIFVVMKHFLLTLWLAMSLAACPNNCSGHGTCESGNCKCNTQLGLGLGLNPDNYHSYTGADCSMRILIFL